MSSLPAHRKAAIFDLDGTLADSMRVWDSICRDWLISQGKLPLAGLEDEIAPLTLTQAARYVRECYGIEKTEAAMLGEWRDIVARLYAGHVTLKEGAAALLRQLTSAGVRLGMATSSFPAACEGFLARHGLLALFSAIVYTDDFPKGKGHPAIWLECARRLGVDASDCVAFEDLRAAGAGIRAAGMGFVAVYDASNRAWEATAAEADVAVRSLAELL